MNVSSQVTVTEATSDMEDGFIVIVSVMVMMSESSVGVGDSWRATRSHRKSRVSQSHYSTTKPKKRGTDRDPFPLAKQQH